MAYRAADVMCKKPFKQGLISFGCGQCLPCRINRRRIWTTRILLEWFTTGVGCFVTLTYADEFLPDGANLSKPELQYFIKDLRRRNNVKLRYFACGEYGDSTWRPHYHLLIFGVVFTARQIQASWGKGRVQVGELNQHTATYVAGYVNKKLTQDSDKLLRGKKPEFALMSRKPGIGSKAVETIVSGMKHDSFRKKMEVEGDVINQIRLGGAMFPLGRFIKKKMREVMGIENEKNKEKRLTRLSVVACEERKELLSEARKVNRSVEAIEMEKRIQRLNRMEKRQKIFSKRGKI